jgi:hypothetical protein
MIELGRQLGFPAEPQHDVLRDQAESGQDFDGDFAAEAFVFRQIDDALTAAAEDPDDPVVRDPSVIGPEHGGAGA